jgi:hypothetical protein
MGVFVTRFVSCVILFVLGLRAPGIMTTRDYLNLNNSSTEHNIEIDVSPYVQSCNAQLLNQSPLSVLYIAAEPSIPNTNSHVLNRY